MENLLDLIIPLIFLIVFSLGSLSKQKKGKEGGEEAEEGEPLPPIGGGKDPLSEIREEIRRKIRENQQQRKPDSGGTTREQPTPYARQQADSTLSEKPRSFNRDQQRSQQVYQQNREVAQRMENMQRMQKQVEEMQKRADAEKRKASKVAGANYGRRDLRISSKRQNRIRRSGVVGEVIGELKRPESSRKAVLNAEILGTPVGLRRPGQSQALWGNG